MARLFALSDHHFGHENIIKYCNRPVSDAAEDRERMIEAHNRIVKDEDVVIFVGDLTASHQGRHWLPDILKRLNGKKYLVRGNHDHLTVTKYTQMGILAVRDVMIVGEYIFCHYPDNPLVVNMAQERGLTLVCGHTHKPFRDYVDNVPRINAAVDVAGIEPILIMENIDEI